MKNQAFNPYLPGWEYIPDGEPHVFGDRVYVYGSHDRFNGKRFCELNYVCWSAPVTDLGDWRFEGEIYDKHQDPICTGFCMKDSPFPKAEHLSEDKGAMAVELEADMLTVKSEPQFIVPCYANGEDTDFEGHEFFEASSMRKIGGRYYFIYSSINSHELCYAVSDSATGGFRYGGTLVSNGDIFLDGSGEEEWTKYTAAYAAPDGTAQLSFIFNGKGAVDFLKFELE